MQEERIILQSNSEVLTLTTNEDPYVSQIVVANVEKDNEMLPMYVIANKDEIINVENQADSWNLVGKYGVEETGTLVSFQSDDDDSLFQEHF